MTTDDATPPPPATIPEYLELVADLSGAWTFHDGGTSRRIELAEVRHEALARAAQLIEWGVRRGDIVGVVGPNDPEWIFSAFGIWYAGAALVPLPAPVRVRDRNGYRAQLGSLVDGLGISRILAAPKFADVLDGLPVHRWDEPAPNAPTAPQVELGRDDLAIVMCTSGSTSQPKGIARKYKHVMPVMDRFSEIPSEYAQPGYSGLSWQPFFHSMGFSGVTMPMAYATEMHVMRAEAFARDPGSWLRLVGPTEAVITAAASSAWNAATRAIERDPAGVDLSSLKYAMFALEMVDPDVVERLCRVGEPLGLDRGALMAMYGLSEGGGTQTQQGKGIRIDEVDLEALTAGRAEPLKAGRASKRIASCGRAHPGVEMEIRDASGASVGERLVGEIVFRTARMTRQYMSGESPVIDGWLHTGDLGYVDDGELFVTGRSKELIVHIGRNYHPEDLEWAAERVEGVTARGTVAFAAPDGTEGAAVLIVEVADREDGVLADQVRATVMNTTGLPLRDVVLVAPGTIPKAANGKLQRLAAKELYARGALSTT